MQKNKCNLENLKTSVDWEINSLRVEIADIKSDIELLKNITVKFPNKKLNKYDAMNYETNKEKLLEEGYFCAHFDNRGTETWIKRVK